MKAISAGLRAHLDGEVTTLATIWTLTRKDGVVFRFTDHDQDLALPDGTYLAATAYSRTAIQATADLAVDNLDLEGILEDDSIKPEEIRAGLFDRAEVRIALVNWSDLGQGLLILRRGWLGEVMINPDGSFRAELRGLTQALAQNVGEVYQAECRADLGDSRCKVDLALYTAAGTITAVTDRRVMTVSVSDPRAVDGWYNGGRAVFTSGENAGKTTEIRSWAAGVLTLHLPTGYLPAIGDTLDLVPGCDKRRDTCINRYANILNYHGEPYLPGRDEILRYPDATG